MEKDGKTTVYLVGKLTEVYGCIEQFTHEKFLTNDVIVTSVGIAHMNEAEHHKDTYAKYGHLFPELLAVPSCIMVAKQGRYSVIKQFLFDDGKEDYLLVILQLKRETDPVDYCNKIITAYRMNQETFNKYVRHKTVLYRCESVTNTCGQ